MSWFKRKNEALNEEGAAQAAPNSASAYVICMVCGRTNGHHRPGCSEATKVEDTGVEGVSRWTNRVGQSGLVASASEGRMNDSERLGHDAVNLPEHYKKFPLEPIRFCQENGLNMLQSSIIKYVVRFRDKNGVEDLKKAARCLDMMIAFEEGDPDWWRLPGERASRRTYIV